MAYIKHNVLLLRKIPAQFTPEKCIEHLKKIPDTEFRNFEFISEHNGFERSGYLTMGSHEDCVRVKEALRDTIMKITFSGEVDCDNCGKVIKQWMFCPCGTRLFCGTRCCVDYFRRTRHLEDCVHPPSSCECLKGDKFPQCVKCVCRKMVYCSVGCVEADLERHSLTCKVKQYEIDLDRAGSHLVADDSAVSFPGHSIGKGRGLGFGVLLGPQGPEQKGKYGRGRLQLKIAEDCGSHISATGKFSGRGRGSCGSGVDLPSTYTGLNNPAVNSSDQGKACPITINTLLKAGKHCMAEDLQMIPLSSEKSQQVVVIHIDSGKNIYVIPIENALLISDLNGLLNEHGKHSYREEVLYVPPPVGAVVLAKLNQEWLRGIVKVVTGSNVTLFFLDYGATVKICMREIIRLPLSAMKIPCFTAAVVSKDNLGMEFKEKKILWIKVIGYTEIGIPKVEIC